MTGLIEFWRRFSTSQRLTLVAVTIGIAAAFGILMNSASSPSMALLYGGLEPAAAGEALAALEALDIATEVRGEAIYVPEGERDAARLALARQGLPQLGQPGFELLDGVSGYDTTSEMFNVAYWRAKEGELARTILATPGVKTARVHLGVPRTSAFTRSSLRPTASATISNGSGRLDIGQATAIRYLVALAVPGLDPEQVAIIDASRGVVLKPGAGEDLAPGGDSEDQAKALERKILELLEARVGPGNARVTVAITVNRERETLTEREYNPESRVIGSREATEQTESGASAPRAVTVASNLPEGEAGNTGGEGSERSETREQLNYLYSEKNRQLEKAPGAVIRTQAAVLLNEPMVENAEGVSEPQKRASEELDAIKELVAAAIGFDAARGDVVTVKAMTFHDVANDQGEEAAAGPLEFLKANLLTILQIIIPAIVVLVLALFVLKPLLSQGSSPVGAAALPGMLTNLPSGNAPIARLASASPVDELRAVAAGNSETSARILKSWLGETEEA